MRLPRSLVLILPLLALAGCEVQRTITITSDPAGALVHLNDQEVGRTPVTIPFTFYGDYDVRLQKQGFAPLWTARKAKSPWWELPGPDLATMVMPDRKVNFDWHFILSPMPTEEGVPTVDVPTIIDRARQMGRRLEDASSTNTSIPQPQPDSPAAPLDG